MTDPRCTNCGHGNAAGANFCGVCGASLKVRAGRQLPEAPPDRFPPTRPAAFQANDALPVLTLLPLDPLPPAPAPRRPATRLPDGLIVSDPEEPRTLEQAQVADRSAAKSSRRALVRRARMAATSHAAPSDSAHTDLLLLERDEATRRQLAGLLESFGFVVYAAHGIAQAESLLAMHRFAGVFLDVVLDDRLDTAPALLCRRVKQPAAHADPRIPGLIVLTERERAADRVRASLAGADGVLVKPASRGDIVRALEDAGVALPHDPRRG